MHHELEAFHFLFTRLHIQSTLDYPELLGPSKSAPDTKYPDI